MKSSSEICVPLLLVNWKTRHPCYLLSAGNGNRYEVSFAQNGENKLLPASISATFSPALRPPSSSQPTVHCSIAHTEQTNRSSPLIPLSLLFFFFQLQPLTLTSFYSCKLSFNLAPHGYNSVNLSHQPTPPNFSVIQHWLIPSVSSLLFTPISPEIHLKELNSTLQFFYPQLVRLDGCEV